MLVAGARGRRSNSNARVEEARDRLTSWLATPWLRDVSDAELGAALRVMLSDPNLPQYGSSADEHVEQLRLCAQLFRQARSNGLRRASALVAVFQATYPDRCDCTISERCEAGCRRIDGVGIVVHCPHCDGSARYCSWPRARIREFLGLGGKK